MVIKQIDIIFNQQVDSIHTKKPERSQKTKVSSQAKTSVYPGSKATHRTGAGDFGRAVNGVGLITMVIMLWIAPSQADITPECNVGTGTDSTECGVDALATGAFSTAAGFSADATGSRSTAAGFSAQATGVSSTAVGFVANAAGPFSTAVGFSTQATARNSTALGYAAHAKSEGAVSLGYRAGLSTPDVTDSPQAIAIGEWSTIAAASRGSIAIGGDVDGDDTGANATGRDAIAIGADASANSDDTTVVGTAATATRDLSVAVGSLARAESEGAVAVGYSAGFNSVISNSTEAIAIGNFSNIGATSPGAIAIGGDVNFDSLGAEASGADAIAIGADAVANQPGAIAIGADVVADIADTMVVGVPVHIKRSDGSSKLLVNETNNIVAVRTLGELENNGGVRFRFNNTALGEEWDFTSNQTGGFQFSLVGSGGAELSVATNGTVRMGPGPISNLTLFPSGNMTIEGVFTENSDRESKQQITELDHESILDKVSALSIHEWEYKDSPDQRHIGPMAQDFHQAFNLGEDNKHIATLDMAGVALAAIQALKQETQLKLIEKDTAIVNLQNQMAELKQQLESVLAMTGGA